MKISICIPTWEQHGYGKEFLKEMFDTIKKQTFKDFEVVISDQSQNKEIEELVGVYKKIFPIFYIKNNNDLGNGPANTNNCIRYAKGKIIKIMFQDDLFVDDEALVKIYNAFMKEKCKWLVSGCNHTSDGKTFTREMIPSWNDEILIGVNTISSPSVLAYMNESPSFFDEKLTMLMDVEYYYQLYKKYGLPYIIADPLISNRMHQYQVSSQYNKNINEEINYVKIKHKW